MRFEEPDEGGSRGELTLHPRVREEATRCPAQTMGGTGLVVLQTRIRGMRAKLERSVRKRPECPKERKVRVAWIRVGVGGTESW